MWLSPLNRFWLLPLRLIPIPFAWVQREINRAGSASATAGGPPPVPWKQALGIAATVLGLAAFACGVWFIERRELAYVMSPDIAGTSIRGVSGVYELQTSEGSWRRRASGTLGDEDSDLELSGPGTDTWIVVYTQAAATMTIEDSVSRRRDAVFGEGTPMWFDERRYFLARADLVPVSVATYVEEERLGERNFFFVLTVRLDTHMVEVIGHTSDEKREQALKDIVLSFAPVAAAQQAEGT